MRLNSALERKEILTQATAWSTPVNTVLNEMSHVQEDEYNRQHRIIATEERGTAARISRVRGRGNGSYIYLLQGFIWNAGEGLQTEW